MQSIILTELGIAILDGERCIESFAFDDAPAEYLAIKSGDATLDNIVRHAESLDTGVRVSDEAMLNILRERSVEAQLMNDAEVEHTRSDRPKLLVDAGFASDPADAMAKLREFAMGLSSAKVAEVSQSPDMHIIQAIRTMDELDKTINAYNSRLREWYGLHFPELENIIDSISAYARIAQMGRRTDISPDSLSSLDDSSVTMISTLATKSRGGEITDENLAMVRKIASHITQLSEQRHELEEHITSEMTHVAPNTSVILGALIGARIISRAGSLKRLAMMPASTIQVLGAEKALFRSLKTGARPPKHGLLFQHQLVHASPRWQRGKMARAIASKAAIAARVDIYGEGINETLLEKLNVRVREIESEPRPPPKPRYEPQRRERPQYDKHNARRGSKKPRARRFDRKSRSR